MDDHREPGEDVDRWLQARIDPLPPPPGTFDLIKKRVRRRRYRQVAVSAAVAAAVAGAVVVVPRVATSVLHVNQNPTAQGAGSAGSATPTASATHSGGSSAADSAKPTPNTPATPTAAPVPQNFQATSVTFVGQHTGWVIGQAGVQRHCATQYCTSMARTSDAGQTWAGVPAPETGAPSGAAGVGQVRFLNDNEGWAFGPQLFATTDGGRTWTEQSASGRVTALETVGTRAFAIFATCTGTGPQFAAQCTSFSLYSTAAGQDGWTRVSGAADLSNGGEDGSASLVLTSDQGYLLAPDGSVYAGPVDGSGPWKQVSSSPAGTISCTPGAAQADGQPSGALLTTANNAGLVLACTLPGGGAQVFTSADQGGTWQQAATVPGGRVTTAATQSGGLIVLSTSDGIQVSRDNGKTWQVVANGTAGPPGGFGWVGMTSGDQGVALPADPFQHTVWFTFDSGQTWRPLAVSG
ncbi:MAG TPA: hypothetical protein VG268_13590 [Streptosporangiaceae bacterium]|nr:hypothetical protein [Streptosporangiaceae bacterium]